MTVAATFGRKDWVKDSIAEADWKRQPSGKLWLNAIPTDVRHSERRYVVLFAAGTSDSLPKPLILGAG